MTPKRILSIGAAYLDINAPGFPHKGKLIAEHELVGKQYHVVPGGSAVNFARVCHSLGLDSMFVGKIGNDTTGSILVDLLTKEGIKPLLISSDHVQTNIGIGLINEKDSTLLVAIGSANQALRAEEVKDKIRTIIAEVDYLYLGGCFKMKSLMPVYVDLINLAHQNNCIVVLDHGRITNEVDLKSRLAMREIIKLSDYYFPSSQEFIKVWGETSIDAAISKLHRNADTTVVVTEGEYGSTTFAKSETFHTPAFKTKTFSPVGAGDSFTAGFIRAHSLGKDLRSCLKFASATAALKISEPGLPTESKVNGLLA